MHIHFGQIEVTHCDTEKKIVECRVTGESDLQKYKDIQADDEPGRVALKITNNDRVQLGLYNLFVPITKGYRFTTAIAAQISEFIRRMPENPLKAALIQGFLNTAEKGAIDTIGPEFNQLQVLRPLWPIARGD